jgi:hypothetical protein
LEYGGNVAWGRNGIGRRGEKEGKCFFGTDTRSDMDKRLLSPALAPRLWQLNPDADVDCLPGGRSYL